MKCLNPRRQIPKHRSCRREEFLRFFEKSALVGSFLTICGLGFTSIGCMVHDMPLTRLCSAAAEGSIPLTNNFIHKGDNVNEADSNGLTPLAWAARGNGSAVVPVLVKAGADVNRRSRGWTPLMHAVDFQNIAVAKRLLETGAKVNERDERQGYTALMLAIELGHEQFVPLFLDNGADPRAKATDEADALTLAVASATPHDGVLSSCLTSTVRQLVSRYPDLAIPNTTWGDHALQRARDLHCDEVLSLVHRR
jgi:ankyrin repeat protein